MNSYETGEVNTLDATLEISPQIRIDKGRDSCPPYDSYIANFLSRLDLLLVWTLDQEAMTFAHAPSFDTETKTVTVDATIKIPVGSASEVASEKYWMMEPESDTPSIAKLARQAETDLNFKVSKLVEAYFAEAGFGASVRAACFSTSFNTFEEVSAP